MLGSSCIFAVVLGFFVTMIVGKTCPLTFVKGAIKDVKSSIFIRNKLYLALTIFTSVVGITVILFILH